MSVMNTGVSGGAAVANQNTGVSLTAAGDYGRLFPSNAAPPGGPDVQGLATVSGTYPSATVVFEKVITPQDFAAGNWTLLSGVVRRDTGVTLTLSAIALAVNQSLDFSIPSVQGFYALRVRRTDAAGGTPIVSGTTFQVAAGAPNPAVLAAYQGLNTLLAANALGMSVLVDADLMAAVGGSF